MPILTLNCIFWSYIICDLIRIKCIEKTMCKSNECYCGNWRGTTDISNLSLHKTYWLVAFLWFLVVLSAYFSLFVIHHNRTSSFSIEDFTHHSMRRFIHSFYCYLRRLKTSESKKEFLQIVYTYILRELCC